MVYLKWGLKSKHWPPFTFFSAENAWKFRHKHYFFYLPSLKTYELYWPLLKLLLYVRRKLLSSNMKVSLKRGYQAPSISCGRLTFFSLNPKFFLCSFLFGVIFQHGRCRGTVQAVWNPRRRERKGGRGKDLLKCLPTWCRLHLSRGRQN